MNIHDIRLDSRIICVVRYSTIDLCVGFVIVWSDHPQEGPATHLILLSIVFRSYEEKSDFAGPPQRMRYFWSTEIQYYSLFASQVRTIFESISIAGS
jgi:hypothetical protein